MKDFGKKLLRIFLLLFWDLISVAAAVFVGIEIVYGFGDTFPIYTALRYIAVYFALIVLFHCIFSMYSLGTKYFGTIDIFKHGVISLIVGAIAFFVPQLLHIQFLNTLRLKCTFVIVVVLFILSCAGHGFLQFYSSVLLYYFKKLTGHGKQINTLIYGAGELGHYLAKRLIMDDSENRPVGFIDDNLDLIGKTVSELKIFGSREALSRIICDKDIGEVILAINVIPKDALREIIAICAESGCRLRRFGAVQDVASPTGRRLDMSDVDTNDLIRRERVELDMGVVSSFIQGKTVLVTGGAGSIGSEICNQVLKYGADKLIIFDICENSLFKIDNKLRAIYDRDRYETILGSIRDTARLEMVFEKYKPQVVFHAAAHKHVPMMEYNPCEAIKNNVFGTLNTAKTATKYGVQKFILISTDKAVNPTNIMGASKRIAEMLIQMEDRHSNTSFAAVRFGNVLGSEGSVVPLFLEQIKKGGPVRVTHPEMKRYFMTIPEAVQLVLEAGSMAKGGEIFVLDMGEPILISDLAADLIRLSGQIPNKDIDIIYTGLRPGEKLFEELSLSEEEVSKTQNNKIYVCKPIPSDENLILEQADILKEHMVSDEEQPIFDAVRKLVPTFNHK
ncbi:MAG: nucleoside-diphosphate sugar epimerase/dehydratase [Oscillospiraceae bacterium]|nr:nucleoside-diphosphate sugar epimerase/dehydratase [Oscillospiraceae bacterium]